MLAIIITILCSTQGLIGARLLVGMALGFLLALGLEENNKDKCNEK